METAEADAEQFTEMLTLIDDLQETVAHINVGFANATAFQRTYDTPIPLEHYSYVYDPQSALLADLRNTIYERAHDWFPGSTSSEPTDVMLQRMHWFLEHNEGTTWTTRFDDCENRVTSRAFNSSFDPLGYYRDTFGFWIDYDYVNFFDFPDNYEYYENMCELYFDPDSYRSTFPLKYEALFTCYSHLDVCDVYMSTKRLHAANILDQMTFDHTPHAELATQWRENYWRLMHATFNDTWSDVASIPEHHTCLQKIDEFEQGSDYFPASGKLKLTYDLGGFTYLYVYSTTHINSSCG